MHHFFLARLIDLLAHYGYVVLFPIAVFEGPIAAMISGAFAASGEFDFLWVFLILVAGDLTGDVLYYSLGRFGHNAFFAGLRAKLGITDVREQPLREGFARHDWKLILLAKTQAFGSVILYLAGATRMRFERFLVWNFIGTVPKVLVFELVGFFFGQSIIHTTRYVDAIGLATLIMGIVLLGGYWLVKRYLEEKLEKTP